MVLGLDNIPGVSNFFAGVDFNTFLQGAGQFILIIAVFVIIAIIVLYILWGIKQKKIYSIKIHWFQEINGQMVPIGDNWARSLPIPQSNISVFYIKEKDLYLPEGTKRMGKKAYWYCIKNNKEIVNFTMKNMNEEAGEAGLDYDHTDMRYAWTNLRDLIKRNYKDKSQPWWREYKEVISLVILIFVLTVAFFFLFNKLEGLVGQIGSLINHADQLVKTAEVARGSGVASP